MTEQSFDVVIVGAGFSGMHLLHRVRGLGLSVRVIEAGSDVGGTWYWNRYPGARVDVESMQYSLQFDEDLQQQWQWSEKYSPQPEVLEYARHVADRFQLRSDIQFNTRISAARFNPTDEQWVLTAEDGSVLAARFFIMATGCLSKPNWPHVEGLNDFTGPTYHTALWPHDPVDFSGCRVAVIGTGSSAIQSIPVIAEQAKELFVFQRTANFAVPAHNQPLDKGYEAQVKSRYAEFRAEANQTFAALNGDYRTRSAHKDSPEEREAEYERRWEAGGLTFLGAYDDLLIDKAANDTASEFVRNKIRSIVDDPAVAESLCPKTIIGAKRLCVDTNYYATYNLPHVHLIDVRERPIEAITARGVRAHGKLYEVDRLVFATGFDAMTGALTAVDIRGRTDRSLSDIWADGPSSYLGLAMADFPNLFTVTGPGSPSVFTNMMPALEQHVEWIAVCLGYMKAHDHKIIEASHAAQTAWWDHHQEIAGRTLKSSIESWYLGSNVHGKARVFMPYFGGYPQYCQKCEDVAANDYEGFVFG